MTVTLKCDLCGKEHMLAPGEHGTYQGTGAEWKWADVSGFYYTIRIKEETLCPLCQGAITEAKEKAELTIREQRKYP